MTVQPLVAHPRHLPSAPAALRPGSVTRTSSLTAPSVLRPVAPTARTDEEVSRQIRDFERLLAALPVGPAVVIDVPGRRLVVNGSEVPLTLQEFDLVVYLARSAGRVVTREELYRAAWHRQTLSPVTRTVDVHVRRVRAKSGLESLITTVRGVGYRLNAIEDLHLVD